MDTASYGHYQIQLSWLIDDWLNEQVASAFQAARGLPEGFEEQWKNRLRLIKTDLDNNDEPDYLIFMSFYPRDMDTFGFHGLYWLRRVQGRYQIELLDTAVVSLDGIEVKATYDLNADGYNDLAYSKIHCGASQCFDNLLIRTYRNGQWQDIPFVDGGWEPNGITIGPGVGGNIVITATEGGCGNLGCEPFFSYDVIFKWDNGEFIPSEKVPHNQTGPIADFQWASHLMDDRRFQEALEVLQRLAEQRVTEPFEYTPYTLMDISIVQLFLRQPAAAQQTWQRILTDYPDALITQYVPNLQVLARGQNSLWRVCRWLRKSDRADWYPPLADIPAVDFLVHPLPTGPSAFCEENHLIVWQTWTREEPIEKQASRLGLTWKLLSARYDLNNDRIKDPIGLLDNHVWAFLSDGQVYRVLDTSVDAPVTASQTGDTYNWPSLKIADRNGDGRPEITSISKDHTYTVEWNGQRFARQDKRDSVGSTPSSAWWHLPSPSPISRAIEAMYRKRDPRQALSLLKGYTSGDPWEAGLARYLEALAWDYLGDTAKAQAAYRVVVQNYAGTGWSAQAKEKIK